MCLIYTCMYIYIACDYVYMMLSYLIIAGKYHLEISPIYGGFPLKNTPKFHDSPQSRRAGDGTGWQPVGTVNYNHLKKVGKWMILPDFTIWYFF